ncbi:MAG: maleylpyruvate isomerase family mycothiol-dependent enzyme [Acidimicrobiales bacterium]
MDTAEAYRTVRERMLTMAEGVDPGTPVPTCPGWTIRELLAHVSGVAEDVLAGNIGDAGTEPWVAAQLASRSGRSLAEITAEWRATGPQVDELCTQLGDAVAQLIFDLVTHEQDLRGALGEPGGDDGAVAVALRWAAERWGSMEPPTQGALRIRVGGIDATQGGGEPAVSVELPPLEALGLLTGRRTRAQVLALPWDGDVDAWLPAFTWGPFVLLA